MSRIAVLLAPDFADWEFGLISGTGGPFYGLAVRFFAPEAGEIASQGGLRILVDHGYADVANWAPDVVAVIGGMAWAGEDPPDPSDILRAQRDRGTTVAGICGGTLALARAGLLDGVAHTSNDAEFLTANASGYAGGARYVETPSAVADQGIVTAPGTAPASFAAEVFAAAGLERDALQSFRRMTAAEHGMPA